MTVISQPVPVEDTDPQLAARHDAISQSGWGNPVYLWQPRNACFWVYTLGIAYGVWIYVGELSIGARLYGSSLAASIIVFSLYALLFWWFTARIDRYSRQPVKLRTAAFAWGGLAASWAIAAPGNSALMGLYAKLFGQQFQLAWGAGLAAPFGEELGKGAAVLLLMRLAPTVVRTAYDGFILGAFAGLGFEIFEDISYGLHSATDEYGSDQLRNTLGTVAIRLLTGFSSHILYSAVVGAGIIYLVGTVAQRRRRGLGIALVLTAMLLHGLWDSNVGLSAGHDLAVLPLMIAESLGAFAVVIWLFHHTVQPERTAMRAVLAPEVTAGVITTEELDTLSGGWRHRRRYRRAAQGRRDRRARRHRLAAAHDLATQIAAAAGAETTQVQFARNELTRIANRNPQSAPRP